MEPIPSSLTPASRIRIMIVDDNLYFREGLRAVLKTSIDFELCGEAVSGEEAVRLALSCAPQVILMDLHLPGINGIEAARQILRETPRTGVIMLTMTEDTASLVEALKAGARGYLLKDAPLEELFRSIIAVANGDALFGAAVAARLVSYVNIASAPAVPLFPELTDREREILSLAAQGLSNAEIAKEGSLSVKTVRNHFSSILLKLSLSDREAAVRSAKSKGLGVH